MFKTDCSVSKDSLSMFKIFKAAIFVLSSDQAFSGIDYSFWIGSTCIFCVQTLNRKTESDGQRWG